MNITSQNNLCHNFARVPLYVAFMVPQWELMDEVPWLSSDNDILPSLAGSSYFLLPLCCITVCNFITIVCLVNCHM